MVNQLIDFCGRGVVMTPTRADFDDLYIGPKLEEALKGASISARDREHLSDRSATLPLAVG